jgi:dCMP deaminase
MIIDIPKNTWKDYFLNMVNYIASKSKDPSTKVGAIIVGEDNEIRSTGFNGLPRGMKDDIPVRNERPLKYKYYEHAERNAIYNSARIGVSIKNCTLYTNIFPCTDCARGIIQSGITKVVVNINTHNERIKTWSEDWKKDIELSMQMLAEAGVDAYFC